MAKVQADAVLEPGLGLAPNERLKILALYAPIIAATVFGFVISSIVGSMSVVLAGLGIVAYVFGLRHGVDADHIAAIDNTTRKLMQEGKRPLTVGTWFSLGHSTIVVGLIVLLVASTRTIAGAIPALQTPAQSSELRFPEPSSGFWGWSM